MKSLLLFLLLIPMIAISQTDNACPIKIIKYKLGKNSIQSNEIILVYKNESNKNIDAMEFSVRCYNNFNEPIRGSLSTGNKFTGISQHKLRAGERDKNTWTMYLMDNATKVDAPIITKVHFTDDTTWESAILD